MKVIFLDIDGVLNNDQHTEFTNGFKKSAVGDAQMQDPESVKVLNTIISKTNSKIVISSDWRFMGLDKLIPILRQWGVDGEIIGETDQISNSPRGWEIQKWMGDWDYSEGRKRSVDIESYLILDDYSDMMYDQRNNFIHVNNDSGLQEKHINKAVQILNNE